MYNNELATIAIPWLRREYWRCAIADDKQLNTYKKFNCRAKTITMIDEQVAFFVSKILGSQRLHHEGL